MTGPEHYQMAEQLLESVANAGISGNMVAKAAVHAMLALAAATALTGGELPARSALVAWYAVAGDLTPPIGEIPSEPA